VTATAPDAARLVVEAESALRANAFPRAEKLLAEAAVLAPGDARIQALRSVAVFQQARFVEALRLAQGSLEIEETYEARLVEGRVSAIARRLPQAVTAYQRCTVLQPSSAEGWSALAAARLATGDGDGAAAAWERLAAIEAPAPAEDRLWTDILRVPPDPAQVQEALDRCARGTAARVAGRYEEAAYELQVVVDSVTTFAHCRTELGRALSRLDRGAEAEQAYRAALRSYRTDQAGLRADTQALLAALLLDRRQGAGEALVLARAARDVRGDRPDVLATLSRACAETRDPSCTAEAGGPAPTSSPRPSPPRGG
jgi:tetratricopeptide (TPR) repeat protein